VAAERMQLYDLTPCSGGLSSCEIMYALSHSSGQQSIFAKEQQNPQ
jgi:hypothetical protein